MSEAGFSVYCGRAQDERIEEACNREEGIRVGAKARGRESQGWVRGGWKKTKTN